MKLALHNKILIVVVTVLCSLFFAYATLFAQSSADIEACADPQDETEEKLCEELDRILEEEKLVEASLNNQKAQSATISRDLNIITGQIQKVSLDIDKKNIAIKQLDKDISLREQTVSQLNEKMVRGKSALSQLIKRTNQLDDISLAEMMLSEDNLSSFFIAVDNYATIQRSLDSLFDEIRDIRGLTEGEKAKLKKKQDEERDVKASIEGQKRTIEVKEDEKELLLSFSKESEATYEQVLAEKRARATQIRSALFRLRDTEGITFGQAVTYAKTVGKLTGVRPALILAILKQESDLGNNVGTCNRAGDPESKKYYSIMPGPVHYANYLAAGSSCTYAESPCSWRDDQTEFKRITKQLGRNFETQPLSCPIASVGGWGGAMGPSQFIPTTWASFEDRIESTLGVSIADPWNPEHAFTATALYMAELGAANGGYTSEHTAAAKYYAGGNYATSYGQSYGTSVLNHAAGYQQQLEFLDGVD
jgi:soluble lytic murein transglycosylase-like protein